ncbi:redoxin domain-containing protein [Polaribacter litorisediminis]|uniref:TlpA disulfide reductase family protein n=1 Tax=Polaribacter litorisediminis TaxID=1908341 RepID=UPI001CC070D6|nr:TlpA disulfide reductase family protein [Polaribacter litorisediminis]UAM99197.1 redoxin domain-containing protein [Polaribacter litorisediminis]
MKTQYYFILLACFLLACNKQTKNTNSTGKKVETSLNITTVKSYNYNQLKPLLEKEDDQIYVVNFWATWCAPCVKELPYFERIKKEYASKNVNVLLVSLDFPKQVEKKLIPFINKKNIQSEVVLLDDINEDFWIKAIDKEWSGALPATLIYNKNKRKFYEKSFDFETLENELKTFLNP